MCIFTLFVYVSESRLFCVTATVFSCNSLNRNRVSFAVKPILLADTEADVGICVCEIGSLLSIHVILWASTLSFYNPVILSTTTLSSCASTLSFSASTLSFQYPVILSISTLSFEHSRYSFRQHPSYPLNITVILWASRYPFSIHVIFWASTLYFEHPCHLCLSLVECYPHFIACLLYTSDAADER